MGCSATGLSRRRRSLDGAGLTEARLVPGDRIGHTDVGHAAARAAVLQKCVDRLSGLEAQDAGSSVEDVDKSALVAKDGSLGENAVATLALNKSYSTEISCPLLKRAPVPALAFI